MPPFAARGVAMRSTFVVQLCLAASLAMAGIATAAERAIDKEVVVAATPAQVYEVWTTKAGITSFFAPDAQIDARVGGAFHVYFDPLADPGAKGADDMRFMALQPNRMVSFDWNAPPHLPQARAQRTFVVVRIEPVDERQTRVRLHHTGWGDGGEWDQTYAYFERAWPNVLANLKKRFDSGPVDWKEWLDALRKMREPKK
jgi:uncharacterized protein YndB with AHSA1/START domain